jgi:hypothetical protein
MAVELNTNSLRAATIKEYHNMKPQNLVISGITIKQDSNSYYRLNDLHKASGGEARHQPARWVAIQQTQELILELTNESVTDIQVTQQIQPLMVKQGGSNQGTYVCRELVLAYATWVSAKFHLHVIRAYDAVVQAERNDLKWLIARGSVKQDFKNMTLALKNYYLDKGEVAPFYAYSTDADMLNLIVIGMKSKQYKQILQLDDKANIREFMTTLQLEAYDYLEVRNAGYLDDGLDFTERTVKLKGLFDKRFRQRLINANDDVISIAHSE